MQTSTVLSAFHTPDFCRQEKYHGQRTTEFMGTRNSHNETSPEDPSNPRRTGYYSHYQALKRTPSAKELCSQCRLLTTPPAKSRPCGSFTNSVEGGLHSPVSSPAPRGMTQEAKHSHEITWSSTCGNCWDGWEAEQHTQDTRSEGDQQPRPRLPGWPITKSSYLADGHQMCTKPTSTTTPSKSSKSPATSKTHQNTLHNTPSTTFGGCRRSRESPGGEAATAAASAPPRRHLCFTCRLLFRSGLIW